MLAPENAPEIAESEPKVVGKRQSGSGFDDNYGDNNREEHGDPYDASSGAYRRPTGYEGPPLSAIGGASTNRGGGGGGGYHGGGGGGYHGGGRGGGGGSHGGDGGYHGRGGGGGGGRGGSGDNDGYDSDFNYNVPDYEREASSATKEYDFTIPREFDPDVQLRPGDRNSGGRSGGGGQGRRGSGGHGTSFSPSGGSGHGPSFSPPSGPPPPPGFGPPGNGPGFQPNYFHNPNRRGGPQQSASSSNRREALDDFDVGYNDYIKQNFPENFNSPGFGGGGTSASPSFSPSNYDFQPNYYHRKSV